MPATLEQQLRALVAPDTGTGRLAAAPTRDSIALSSASVPIPTKGIRGPLIEDETRRTYYAERTIYSSDCSLTIAYAPFKERVFIDANGTELIMLHADMPDCERDPDTGECLPCVAEDTGTDTDTGA